MKDIKRNTKARLKKSITLFPVVLPIVFVLVFFGYFRVNYDIVLQTENVKGEGICQTYMCPPVGVATRYKAEFYFGSELKKATLQGFHYDVDRLYLITSDVEEFDIKCIDSYIKGIHLGHFESKDILPDGESLEGTESTLFSENGVLHVDVVDPDAGATVRLKLGFIPTWFWIVYFAGMMLLAAFMSFVMSFVLDSIPALEYPLMSVSCIAVTLLVGCFFCGSMPFVTYVNFLLNWLFLFAASLFLNALTLPYLGTVLTMAFTTIWYIANYFVITLRGKPIMPADLKAADTAAEVMGGYSFAPNWQMILGVIIVIIYATASVVIWKKTRPKEKPTLNKRIAVRCISATAALLLMVIGINTNTFRELDSFAWDAVLLKSFHEEGMVLTYIKSALNTRVKEPEGYSRDKVDEYLSEYLTKDSESYSQVADKTKPARIIMVMNEAFADLREVGLDENIDVMPYIDSLEENTVKGNLYVSIFGGGTCNTEFEALTGNSLAFLGAGAYPYTENVTEPLFSLAQYFKDMGYGTEAFHANDANNWNRNMVYPYLGFDKFHSIEDYEKLGEIAYLHEQPADISDYNYIESVDKEYSGKNRFLFNVTMQNHSGYERWLDVEKAESVAENGDDLYVDAQIYLSLIKASDDEVEQMIETYQDSEEPTMIIFFGDHQPGLPGAAIKEIYTELEYNIDLYKTRLFIWTNYDTEEQSDIKISANYMPWLILERGNFELPPYVQMLKEVHEKYPIISSQGVMDSEGNVYAGIADVADDPLIKKYQYIQYANLYDELDGAWFK